MFFDRAFRIQFFLVLTCITGLHGDRLQCKDESGQPVDWYILYKLPVIQKTTNYLLRKGLAYAYLTSNQQDDWKLSQYSINDTRSIPGQTLAPLYSTSNNNILQLLYNDEPPSSSTSLAHGHTKGTILGDTKEGFWLIHSVPNFPIEPCTVIKQEKNATTPATNKKCHQNKYFYPKTAERYGQSFLCISVTSNEYDTIGTQLLYNKPKLYAVNVPEELEKYPQLALAAKKKYIKTAPWNHKANLTSVGGTNFINFAKTAQFNKELYSDWLAIDFQEDLNVETWANGAGDFPSECTKQYKIQDVKELGVTLDKTSITFKNSQDHSKWAVSVEKTQPWVCIGDINRMVAQLKRGGGTTCFQNIKIWDKFTKMIHEVEPCPLHGRKETNSKSTTSPRPSVSVANS